ncbi:cyclic nucleotide phosphodiesterase [Gottschalkiaceae bacterium SANA]|nr:cyclic nucleotide phosphodiesterase [Gottschalkiaceae bacterium SANA]
MKKLWGILIIAGALLILPGCQAEAVDKHEAESDLPGHVNMIVATDIHHLATSLKDDGKALMDFVYSGDGKLLQYSDELLEVFVHDVQAQAPDFVVLSGDLTNNGEKESHQELAEYLAEVEKKGIQVFVIPGNHDLLNPFALGFEGRKRKRVDSVEPSEFVEIYQDYGYGEALSRDPHSLSYLVRPTDDLALLMLDTNRYEQNMQIGLSNPSGFVRNETMHWIDEVLSSLNETEIIAVMHHNAIPHSQMFVDNFVLDNSKETMDLLAEYKVRVVLSGHTHIQDLIQDPETGIFDFTTSAMSVYPHGYGLLSLDQGSIIYTCKALDMESYAKEKQWKDENLLNFIDFAPRFFVGRSEQKLKAQIPDSFTPKQKEEMMTVMGQLNLAYFAGVEADEKEHIKQLKGYKELREVESAFLQYYIDSILLDETNDNYMRIEREEE